ncbi:MAG TPA: hypothetical protein VHA73_05020 [Acidimicrobiales bacterium]|jgi:hypothetical protein|nr:hypothetical protein [Acidimicrobiales bacterium]
MKLKAGLKLQSAVSDVQVVVVRAPDDEVELACGGAPLLGPDDQADGSASLDASLGDGPALGKRYADEDLGVELLCTKAGDGALTANGTVLPVKGAKPLPASD